MRAREPVSFTLFLWTSASRIAASRSSKITNVVVHLLAAINTVIALKLGGFSNSKSNRAIVLLLVLIKTFSGLVDSESVVAVLQVNKVS